MGNALSRSAPRSIFTLILAAAVHAGCATAPAPRDIQLHRVTLVLQPDGMLDVTEEITARFADGAARFRHRVASGRFDAILDLRTRLDGREIQDETFTAVSERAHTLMLQYRVAGSLQLEGRQRRLTWRAVEGGRALPVGQAVVSLQVPRDVAILMPSGMAEADWHVSVGGDRLTAMRDNVPAAEGGTLMALLSGDALPLREPRWQFDAARSGELSPAFLAGGAFILVVALGILGMLWWHDRRSSPTERRHQLRVSAAVIFLSAVVWAVTVQLLLARLGWAPHAIGAGLALSALLFVLMSFRYPKTQ